MRINKLLSNFGICSRKEANRYIEDGRIIVNGEQCIKGQWVELSDHILLDGEVLKPKEKVYIALYKPIGVTCTLDPEVDGNIAEYMNYKEYIFPVGRLDKESEGLIIMTNDGDMANRILEADNHHEKEYIVTVDRELDDEFIKNMASGVDILGVRTRECEVTKVDDFTFRIILTQGLNRQIRRMCRALHYNVVKLKRIRILSLTVDGIEEGCWRKLTPYEIEKLSV